MTTNEVQDYLDNIISILDSNGKLVVLFDRDKNKTFQYLYKITTKEVEEVLRSLKVSDFEKKELSKNDSHKKRELYFFSPTRIYVAANGREDTMKLYIKIDLYSDKNLIVVISFHEYGDFSEEVN